MEQTPEIIEVNSLALSVPEQAKLTWYYGWCKEHKTMFMNVYVPSNTKVLRLLQLSTLQILFD